MFSVITLLFGILMLSQALAQDELFQTETAPSNQVETLRQGQKFSPDYARNDDAVERYSWKPLANTFAGTPQALATSWSNQILLLTQDGSIYRSRSQLGFERVFDFSQIRLNDDEDIYLQVEGSIQEQWDSELSPDVDPDEEDVRPAELLNNEWESIIDDPLLRTNRAAFEGVLWSDQRSPLVISCHKNQCVYSNDNGSSWKVTNGLVGVKDICRFKGDLWALTTDGFRLSRNNAGDWSPVRSQYATASTALICDDEVMILGSQNGPLISINGRQWSSVQQSQNSDSTPVLDLAFATGTAELVMLVTPKTLLRSMDLTQTFSEVAPNPGLLRLFSSDDTLSGLQPNARATSRTPMIGYGGPGVYAVDVAQNKISLLDGSSQIGRAISVTDWSGTLVVATEQGLFMWTSASEPISNASVKKPEVSLDALLKRASDADAQQLDALQVSGRLSLLRYLPSLSTSFDVSRDRSIAVNNSSFSSVGTDIISFRAMLGLCFGNCQSAAISSSYDGAVAGEVDISDTVMVVGDSIYRADIGGVVPAANQVLTKRLSSRQKRFDKLVSLHRQLRELERIPLVEPTLQQSLQHELQIQETLAYIDVITDGGASVINKPLSE